MLPKHQQDLMDHFLLREQSLIPRLNELGKELFRTGFNWLRTTQPTDLPLGCTLNLYNIETSEEPSQVVLVSFSKKAFVYRTPTNQEITIHESEFKDYMVKPV